MEVVWSDNALTSARAAADYALQEFGDMQVRKLHEKFRAATRKLSIMPAACPIEQNLMELTPVYRYVTLFPHLELIFHEVDDNTCMVDLIWNTRRNPKSLQAIIKSKQ